MGCAPVCLAMRVTCITCAAYVPVVLSVLEETYKHNCVLNTVTLMQEQLRFQIVYVRLDIAAQTVVCAQLALLASGRMQEGAQSVASALKIRTVCQRVWRQGYQLICAEARAEANAAHDQFLL